ncbi:hypothetical protein [Rhizobacter sp. P5_C2]
MELRPQTLIVAVQCVARRIHELDKLIDEVDSQEAGQLEELLVSFDLAAADLKKAYAEAREKFADMPDYEQLPKPDL